MTGAASRVPAMPTMPHMLLAFRSLGGALARPEFRRPAWHFLLLGARDGERIRFHLARDHRARADIDAVAHLYGRDQRRVRPDECALADVGEVLVEAVIVAGDRARADIGALAHPRIAEIGEMVRLRALLDPRVLHLDEIADMDVFLDARARPEPCKRPDDRAARDLGAFEMRK